MPARPGSSCPEGGVGRGYDLSDILRQDAAGNFEEFHLGTGHGPGQPRTTCSSNARERTPQVTAAARVIAPRSGRQEGPIRTGGVSKVHAVLDLLEPACDAAGDADSRSGCASWPERCRRPVTGAPRAMTTRQHGTLQALACLYTLTKHSPDNGCQRPARRRRLARTDADRDPPASPSLLCLRRNRRNPIRLTRTKGGLPSPR